MNQLFYWLDGNWKSSGVTPRGTGFATPSFTFCLWRKILGYGYGYDFRFGQCETLRTGQHAPSGSIRAGQQLYRCPTFRDWIKEWRLVNRLSFSYLTIEM
jgi:hypothetical protein